MDFEEQTPIELPRDRLFPESPEAALFRLTLIGVVVPATAVLVIWAWAQLEGHIFTNKEIRFLCLLIWAGTLGTLAVAAIGGRHKGGATGPRTRRQLLVPLDGKPTSLERWEQRSARQLLYEAAGAAFAVPAISLGCLFIWLRIAGVAWTPHVVSETAPFLWGGGLAGAAIIAGSSTRRRLVYRTRPPANAPAHAYEQVPESGGDDGFE